MKGFYPAVHHFGKTGIVGDFADRDSRFGKRFRGAAGGENFHIPGRQRRPQFGEACLVGDGKKGAADGNKIGHDKGIQIVGNLCPPRNQLPGARQGKSAGVSLRAAAGSLRSPTGA